MSFADEVLAVIPKNKAEAATARMLFKSNPAFTDCSLVSTALGQLYRAKKITRTENTTDTTGQYMYWVDGAANEAAAAPKKPDVSTPPTIETTASEPITISVLDHDVIDPISQPMAAPTKEAPRVREHVSPPSNFLDAPELPSHTVAASPITEGRSFSIDDIPADAGVAEVALAIARSLAATPPIQANIPPIPVSCPESNTSPLDVQIGGDHYKKLGIYQPWEVLKRWLTPEEFRGYMKGTAIAYLARERDKGGDQDIDKSRHTLEGLLSMIGGEA